jgi:hypothetical protein
MPTNRVIDKETKVAWMEPGTPHSRATLCSDWDTGMQRWRRGDLRAYIQQFDKVSYRVAMKLGSKMKGEV